MKFFRSLMANLSISLSLSLIVVAILSVYNPMMGFLQSKSALVLILITCVVSIISSFASYMDWRQEREYYDDEEDYMDL